MSDAYDNISKVWLQFPKELENSTLYDDVNKLKNTFEDKKHFFENYLTKIIIIGNVSTGKSTLINTLLGKEYFGTEETHGTNTFFYCSLSEKNYEYFTINDCLVEHKDNSILKNATTLNVILPYFVNEKNVVKVYINHESRILERKTVIVDCPGLGHDERFDEEIGKHCSKADLFIFVFQINEPATLNQKNYIQTIRDNLRNPTFFFVYNKCDSEEFNDECRANLKHEFSELFGKQYFRSLKINNDPLYFISALKPDEHEDFSRLNTDILAHKNVNYIRFANVQAILMDEVDKFCKTVGDLVSNERRKKLSMLKSIDELKSQTKHASEKYSELINYVQKRIENSKDNLQINTIFNTILEIIDKHTECCNKHKTPQMISKIEENIKTEVNKLMEKHLKDLCIDPINNKIQDINKDNSTDITMDNDVVYDISLDLLTIPNYDNIQKQFWFWEKGDLATKVKEIYSTHIQANKKQLTDSITDFYKNKCSKMEINYLELVECTKRKQEKKENNLKEDLKKLEFKLEILTNYERDVHEDRKKFNSSFI